MYFVAHKPITRERTVDVISLPCHRQSSVLTSRRGVLRACIKYNLRISTAGGRPQRTDFWR